ncbi:glycosyltransferase [Chloroflexota bacterium]
MFYISLFVFVWMFLGYPSVMWIVSKLWVCKVVVDDGFIPQVTIIVCTYNEAGTIARRISNLLDSDYPEEQLEIIVVDSSSPDGTVQLVHSLIEGHHTGNRIRLIQENTRRGKVSAINMGLAAATGEIVILTDGPSLFWKDTIRLVVQSFADQSVGAATGYFVKHDSEEKTASQETEWVVFNYRKVLRSLESTVDSTTWLSGELTAFRRSLVPVIPPSVIIDDAYIAMAVREQGYRVIVDERARYTEKRPTAYGETITIKKKSVVGSVQEMIRFRRMLFNMKYKWYGMLILPARLLHLYLNPLVFLALVLSGLGLALLYVGIVPVLLIFGGLLVVALLLYMYRGGVLLRPLIAFLLMEWIILGGLYQYMTGSYSAVWKQVKSTRETS